MSVRSGSATPWHEWDGYLGPMGEFVYVRDGTLIGDKGLLAEALRADGIASGLGWGYRLAEEAQYMPGFYGYVEDMRQPTACDEQGLTMDGEQVTRVLPCVFAVLVGE